MLRVVDIQRVSTDSAGNQGNGDSGGVIDGFHYSAGPVFAPDGTKIAFVSNADNLGPAGGSLVHDVFLKDLITGNVTRVSTGLHGNQANASSFNPIFSPDGTKLVFTSDASNLVLGDTSKIGDRDIFLKDLVTSELSRVAPIGGIPGITGDNNFTPLQPVFSPDGTKLAFASLSNDLVEGDINGFGFDLFVKDLITGEFTLFSTAADGTQTAEDGESFAPVFSPDGTKVAFWSPASNLVPDDTNEAADIFIKDFITGEITRVSTNSNGEQTEPFTTPTTFGSAHSFHPIFSPDGTKLLFASYASNLAAEDIDGELDLFLKDLFTGEVTLLSTGAGDGTFQPHFSPDGTKVVFTKWDKTLVPGDENGAADIYIKDLITGELTRISTDASGHEANFGSFSPVFSPDGTQVTFWSYASNLVPGDTNKSADVFVVTLADDLNLTGTAGNDLLEGGAGGDAINGIHGNDTILGSGGGDTLTGWTGDDLIDGGAEHDRLLGGSGNDTLLGGAGNDYLSGFNGNDSLNGQAGNDTIAGGEGLDILWGGAGQDVFTYFSLADSSLSSADRIRDFTQGEDKIVLFAIESIEDFGDLLITVGAATTLIRDNDPETDFAIRLQGSYALTPDDFLI